MSGKNFYSLSELTLAERDGQIQHHWKVVNKPQANRGKNYRPDERAGQTIVAQYTGPVTLTPGTYLVRFGTNDDGTIRVWGVTPTDIRCTVDFVGFPVVQRGLRDGVKADPVVIGAYGRYIIAEFQINDAESAFNGLTFSAFLNVDPDDLVKSSRGVITRSFLRSVFHLSSNGDILKEVSSRYNANIPGAEWCAVNDLGLMNGRGLKARLDGTGKLVELFGTVEADLKRQELLAQLAALGD